MYSRIVVAALLLLNAVSASGQSDREDYTALIDESIDYSAFSLQLEDYRQHPLDINKADKADFGNFPFLSELQLNALFEHIALNGPLLELYELQSIAYFDLTTIQQLLPFIRVNIDPNWNRLKGLRFKSYNSITTRIQRIIEPQAGYLQPGTYEGSAYKLYTRYTYNYKNILSANLTAEKDAGEPFFRKYNPQGFDFYSGSVALNNIKQLKKLIIGDYEVQLGQGLAFYNGLSLGKSTEVIAIAKNAAGIRPYRAVNEAFFLRGIAAEGQLKRWNALFFASYRHQDALVRATDSSNSIQSNEVSGMHRTLKEYVSKNTLLQKVIGSQIKYNFKKIQLGINWTRMQFKGLRAESIHLFEQGNPQEKNIASVQYQWNLASSYLFGELAYSNGATANIHGLILALSPQMAISLAYRRYEPLYEAFYTRALSENTYPRNEQGWYTGISFYPNKRWKWNSYLDLYRFPLAQYHKISPSAGFDLFTQLNYTPSKRLKLYGRYRNQHKQENQDGEAIIPYLVQVVQSTWRFQLDYTLYEDLSLSNRLDWLAYAKEGLAPVRSSALYQDIHYQLPQWKISIDARYTLFTIGAYDARLYTLEQDIPGAYSAPILQQNGYRWYVLLRKTLFKGLDVWLRYAQLSYDDAKTMGTGNELIEGNRQSEMKAQVRWQF